jgi:hypothetical protein
MEITIHKISAAHTVTRMDIVKADDAFHFFLSIDWLLNIVYTLEAFEVITWVICQPYILN